MSKQLILDEDYGQVHYEIHEGVPFLHFNCYEWSKDNLITMRAVFSEILAEFAAKGWKFVCTALPIEDAKMKKFNEMFGFEELIVKGPARIMVREIAHGD